MTDSTASLSAADAEGEGITVVPLRVVIGADTFVEGVDVHAGDIAAALKDFLPVSTSRPNPEEFIAAYTELADQGAKEIVSVHLSRRMSGTLESAELAAKEVGIPVLCVDSAQVGLATGLAAGRAARARGKGVSAEQVAEVARKAGQSSTVLIYVDTLEYLRRGGRVGSAAALIGSALSVKPLLTIRRGVVVPLEKVRTSGRAIARMEHLTLECIDGAPDFDIGVQHLANEPLAAQVAQRLATALHREHVPVDEVGAVIGAHVGPGMVAVTITR